MSERDWAAWHTMYDDPTSAMPHRLARVRHRIRESLDSMPDGPIRVISMCAGQGRDLLGVLPEHPRREDVSARLVEIDPGLAGDARGSIAAAGLGESVAVVLGDAADCSVYAGMVPADLVLVCGVFGNIIESDIRRTVENLPRLCRVGATVLWTRHREPPDFTPTVRQWFRSCGFAEIGFDFEDGRHWSVGANRLTGAALPYDPGVRLFEFGLA